MVPLPRSTRWLALGVGLTLLPACLDACQRDTSSQTPAPRPIDELNAGNLRRSVESLGFRAVTATTSKSKGFTNVTVVGLKEHPEGIEGPDGKTRLRIVVSLYADPLGHGDRSAALDAARAAYVQQGRRTLAIELSNRDRDEAQRLLNRLVR